MCLFVNDVCRKTLCINVRRIRTAALLLHNQQNISLAHHFGVMPNAAYPMVLQEFAQMTKWRQLLESLLHETNVREIAHIRRNCEHVRRHHALSKELAIEKRQHGSTMQQLSGVKQNNLQLADELKVRLLILLPALCRGFFRAPRQGGWGGHTAQYVTALYDCCWRMHATSATLCQPNLAVQTARLVMHTVFRPVFFHAGSYHIINLSLLVK